MPCADPQRCRRLAATLLLAAALVPGASILVSRAVRAVDGTVSASRLTVGVNGTRLPM